MASLIAGGVAAPIISAASEKAKRVAQEDSTARFLQTHGNKILPGSFREDTGGNELAAGLAKAYHNRGASMENVLMEAVADTAIYGIEEGVMRNMVPVGVASMPYAARAASMVGGARKMVGGYIAGTASGYFDRNATWRARNKAAMQDFETLSDSLPATDEGIEEVEEMIEATRDTNWSSRIRGAFRELTLDEAMSNFVAAVKMQQGKAVVYTQYTFVAHAALVKSRGMKSRYLLPAKGFQSSKVTRAFRKFRKSTDEDAATTMKSFLWDITVDRPASVKNMTEKQMSSLSAEAMARVVTTTQADLIQDEGSARASMNRVMSRHLDTLSSMPLGEVVQGGRVILGLMFLTLGTVSVGTAVAGTATLSGAAWGVGYGSYGLLATIFPGKTFDYTLVLGTMAGAAGLIYAASAGVPAMGVYSTVTASAAKWFGGLGMIDRTTMSAAGWWKTDSQRDFDEGKPVGIVAATKGYGVKGIAGIWGGASGIYQGTLAMVTPGAAGIVQAATAANEFQTDEQENRETAIWQALPDFMGGISLSPELEE